MPPFVLVTFSFGLLQALMLHALLVMLGLAFLSDGQVCSVWTCWQTPGICHTQLPSYSVPPRGGWQLFWYFCLVKSPGVEWLQPNAGRNVRAPEVSPKCRPAGWPWHGSCPSCTASRKMHEAASMTALGTSFSCGPLLQTDGCKFSSG